MSAQLGTVAAVIEGRDVLAEIALTYEAEFRDLAQRLPATDPSLARVLLLVHALDRAREAEAAWKTASDAAATWKSK